MAHHLFRHLNTNHIINLDYKINIIACQINNLGSIPFLQFLLEKDTSGCLSFPFIQGPSTDLRHDCIAQFPEFNKITYTGYVILNKEVYVFVSILDVPQSYKIPLSNNRWLCLVDEILNYRYLLDCFKINKKCIAFLISNNDYYTLRNGMGAGIEIPYVAYLTSDNIKQTEIDHYFGPTKQEYEHYVFESRDDLIKKEGVIRYAVFGTTPITIDGKTRWFVRNMNNVVSLSCHLMLK